MQNYQKYIPFMKYIFCLFVFGSNGIVGSFIALNSYEIVLFRTGIGSIFLIAVFFLTKGKLTFHKYKKQSLFLVISGIALGFGWIFLYEAYIQIGVSIASLLYYSGPIIVIILSPVLFKEKLTIIKITGFFTVLCGIVFINGSALVNQKNVIGILCGLAAAVMYAITIICNKKVFNITGLENSMLQLFISFLTVAVFTMFRQGFTIIIPPSSIFPLLFLGIINTGVGCYLYFSSVCHLPVQSVAVLSYLEPVSAILFSAFFLHETMFPIQIIGTFLILGGAIFSESFKPQWLSKISSSQR